MANITPLYLDTSAAVKLFLPEEKGSEELKDFLQSSKPYSLVSSSLLQVEIQSVLRRLSRMQISSEDLLSLENLASQLLKHVIQKPITEKVMEDAIHILKHSNISGRLRSLDSLHFATFLSFTFLFPYTTLITSDTSLFQLAVEHNLKVFNPEDNIKIN